MKGRTNEEGSDPVRDKRADDAGGLGQLECQGGTSRSEAETACRRQPAGRAKPGNNGAPRKRNMIEEILEPENLAAAWTAMPRQRPTTHGGA